MGQLVYCSTAVGLLARVRFAVIFVPLNFLARVLENILVVGCTRNSFICILVVSMNFHNFGTCLAQFCIAEVWRIFVRVSELICTHLKAWVAAKMGSRYFQRPENAISKADEFIKVRNRTVLVSLNWVRFWIIYLVTWRGWFSNGRKSHIITWTFRLVNQAELWTLSMMLSRARRGTTLTGDPFWKLFLC